ncbi:MAG: hypothetical protein K2N35_00870, partial [Muribaculaceae bacterium]|nr:hypothetical protein [Muribaculaceae bacterium]
VVIKNSKIGVCGSGVDKITMINCNVNSFEAYPRYMISSILNRDGEMGNQSARGTLINCLLRYSSSKATLKDCHIIDSSTNLLDDNLEATVDLSNYLGQDGTTVVGIHGGESPFSENPSVPTVDTTKSSVNYDATANKLKVSISVKAD